MGIMVPEIVFDKLMDRAQVHRVVTSLGKQENIKSVSSFGLTCLETDRAELIIFPREGGKDRVKLSRLKEVA